MADLTRLERLTKELAVEVHEGINGTVFGLLRMILDNVDTAAVVIDNTDNIIFSNKAMDKFLDKYNMSAVPNEKWYHVWGYNSPVKIEDAPHTLALENREVITKTLKGPVSKKVLQVTAIPLIYNGVSGTINFIKIIGDVK